MKVTTAIVALILISGTALAQTTCKSCAVGSLDDQFPEAPEPIERRADGGLQHDRNADQLAKRRLFTKTWVGAYSFYLGTIVFDVETTHQGLAHHRCQEGNLELGPRPSRGELYRDNLLKEYLPLTAINLLLQAAWRGDGQPKAWKWVPLIGAGYGSTVHLRGGIEWYQRCW